ncbi:MAG: hypothetical protein HGA85_03865 [Nanoarchaeota archaeon]|nr:hypothetical protein [Nanoarchaeota archaeon]
MKMTPMVTAIELEPRIIHGLTAPVYGRAEVELKDGSVKLSLWESQEWPGGVQTCRTVIEYDPMRIGNSGSIEISREISYKKDGESIYPPRILEILEAGLPKQEFMVAKGRIWSTNAYGGYSDAKALEAIAESLIEIKPQLMAGLQSQGSADIRYDRLIDKLTAASHSRLMPATDAKDWCDS